MSKLHMSPAFYVLALVFSILVIVAGVYIGVTIDTDKTKKLKEQQLALEDNKMAVKIFLLWLKQNRPRVAGLGAPILMLKHILEDHTELLPVFNIEAISKELLDELHQHTRVCTTEEEEDIFLNGVNSGFHYGLSVASKDISISFLRWVRVNGYCSTDNDSNAVSIEMLFDKWKEEACSL